MMKGYHTGHGPGTVGGYHLLAPTNKDIVASPTASSGLQNSFVEAHSIAYFHRGPKLLDDVVLAPAEQAGVGTVEKQQPGADQVRPYGERELSFFVFVEQDSVGYRGFLDQCDYIFRAQVLVWHGLA